MRLHEAWARVVWRDGELVAGLDCVARLMRGKGERMGSLEV
jgi:hypothetical protein